MFVGAWLKNMGAPTTSYDLRRRSSVWVRGGGSGVGDDRHYPSDHRDWFGAGGDHGRRRSAVLCPRDTVSGFAAVLSE